MFEILWRSVSYIIYRDFFHFYNVSFFFHDFSYHFFDYFFFAVLRIEISIFLLNEFGWGVDYDYHFLVLFLILTFIKPILLHLLIEIKWKSSKEKWRVCKRKNLIRLGGPIIRTKAKNANEMSLEQKSTPTYSNLKWERKAQGALDPIGIIMCQLWASNIIFRFYSSILNLFKL